MENVVNDLVSDIENKLKIKDKRIMHYRSNEKILLVGEGDFSFATCLANAFGDASNLFATSLDSYRMFRLCQVIERYANAKRNIEVLKEKGCVVLHEVDAHTMSRHAILRQHCFDVIVFNFPHADLVYREHDQFQIELHRDLVRGFLKNAYELVSYEGQIHITHKTAYPFDRWNIRELAKEARMEYVVETEFNEWDYYPGYCNKKGEGHGIKCDESFPVGACSTFIISIISVM
ncbi:uncharacterized protein At4g26485-like [Silene latifolia]|uniref:uncharacterized protein At4g26485-like n=1 Tax=Silene latifolia TaxID=37657 RepID=UPI003D77DB00